MRIKTRATTAAAYDSGSAVSLGAEPETNAFATSLTTDFMTDQTKYEMDNEKRTKIKNKQKHKMRKGQKHLAVHYLGH